jgi:para-nitrobenzyl esterase
MRRPIALLLFLALTSHAHAAVESGLWYDRQHAGHGLDLHRAGGQLFGAFYTYDGSGAVTWLWLQTADADAPTATLTRYRRVGGAIVGGNAGTIALTPVATCPDGLARPGARALLRMDFTLDGTTASWCVEPLLPASPEPLAVLSGAWFDPAEPGWGVMSHAYEGQVYRTIYFHDAAGDPRWAFAQDAATALTQAQTYFAPRVECFGCPVFVGLTVPVGTATTTLTQPLATADARRNGIELSLRVGDGTAFARSAPLALLSTPRRVPGAAATREGPVAGRVLASGVERFDNVPYAAPPTGALRWRAPQPAAVRNVVREARTLGPGCPQPAPQGASGAAPPSQSEDCLQLYAWRPAAAGPHPVLVWIHGGGLTQGSAVQQIAGQLTYDGERWARAGVVFVSINYRLGPLGYLAQRDFVGEAADQPQAGNYGLLDQVAALAWVRDNIAAFGGDPAQVTIFGESAGGVSTCALLATPAARGTFQRVIVQSGNCYWNPPSLATGLAQGDRVTQAAGCANATDRRACLRALTPAQLLAAVPPVIDPAGLSDGESFGLVLDGFALPEAPGRAIAGGRVPPLPLMIGVTDDETTTLVPASTLPATVGGYEAAIRARFPTIADAVLARYPAGAYPTPQRAYQDVLDDLLFVCAARRSAADHAARGNIAYHFALTEVLPDLAPLESFHALDVVLLFGPRTQAQAPEAALAARMQAAWVDFAFGREPGSSGGIAWPRYLPATRTSLELNAARTAPLADYRGAYCDFWQQYVTL